MKKVEMAEIGVTEFNFGGNNSISFWQKNGKFKTTNSTFLVEGFEGLFTFFRTIKVIMMMLNLCY
jgi:hypothetical protein